MAMLAGGVSALVGGVLLLPPLVAGRYVAAADPGPKRGGLASAGAAGHAVRAVPGQPKHQVGPAHRRAPRHGRGQVRQRAQAPTAGGLAGPRLGLLRARGQPARQWSGAVPLLLQHHQWGPRLTTVVQVGRAYRGYFTEGLLARGLRNEASSRPPSTRGFVPVGCRWAVERTFAWLNLFRRLVMDYEYTPESHAA
ncbi:hypothetical protein DNI29_21335 [Hymenobacter sediminis]|nr:hypothetical protein DNI29_21335 [Hymenobacter sediminis]